MNRKRNQRGYIMVVVLLCTAAISLTGALVFTASQDQMVATQALRNQTIAAARANMGAQRALAELRMATPPDYVDLRDKVAYCTQGYDACTAACKTNPNCNIFRQGPILDRGRTGSLAAGGGSIYNIRLFMEQKPGDEMPTTMIESTGYYGYDPSVVPGATRYESRVLVEVGGIDEPTDPCPGYCGGGLN